MALSDFWRNLQKTARTMPRESRTPRVAPAIQRAVPRPAPANVSAPAPSPIPTSALGGGGDLASAFAAPGVKAAPTIEPWSKHLPWEDVWGRVTPTLTEAAFGQVTPEVMRNYLQTYRDYMGGMASAGGGRFGRGWGGAGGLAAGAERQRKEMAQDWMDQYQMAMQDWYGRTGEAYGTAALAGDVYEDYKVPTWEEAYKMVNPMGTPTRMADWQTSPVLGYHAPRQAAAPEQALGGPGGKKGPRYSIGPVT